MERNIVKTKILGKDLTAEITQMPKDIHILLAGGEMPHTGSVSIYEHGERIAKILLPGHKDDLVGDMWAEKISKTRNCRVTVVCGIHYDNATPVMIRKIRQQAEKLLKEVL